MRTNNEMTGTQVGDNGNTSRQKEVEANAAQEVTEQVRLLRKEADDRSTSHLGRNEKKDQGGKGCLSGRNGRGQERRGSGGTGEDLQRKICRSGMEDDNQEKVQDLRKKTAGREQGI